MPIDADALEEWSRRHGGYDVSRSAPVRRWLSLVHGVARPLARRGVSPDAVTTAGVVTAAGACLAPPPMAAALVVATSVLDGVDGAIAVQRRRDVRHGVVVDHLADRVSDALFAVALRRAGCPRRVAAMALATSLGYELLRDGIRLVTGRDPGVVTVGDRPMRVVTVAAGLVLAPTVGGVAVGAQSVVGVGQLLRARRQSSQASSSSGST